MRLTLHDTDCKPWTVEYRGEKGGKWLFEFRDSRGLPAPRLARLSPVTLTNGRRARRSVRQQTGVDIFFSAVQHVGELSRIARGLSPLGGSMTLEQRKRAARVLMARIELDQAIGALTGAPVAEYNAVAGIGNARYYELLEEVFKFISASPVLQRARLAPLREKHRQLGALLENAQQR